MQVKDRKGLLVISTSFHDSRRSANQLKGRAGRQGDPGETLTLYDFEDSAFVGDATMAAVRGKHPCVQNIAGLIASLYLCIILIQAYIDTLQAGSTNMHNDLIGGAAYFWGLLLLHPTTTCWYLIYSVVPMARTSPLPPSLDIIRPPSRSARKLCLVTSLL